MTGNVLMKILLVQYVIIAIVFMFEKNYGKAVYWIGACIITIGVLVMK